VEDPSGELGLVQRWRACRYRGESAFTPSTLTVVERDQIERAGTADGRRLATAAALGTLEVWNFRHGVCSIGAYVEDTTGCAIWSEEYRARIYFDGHAVWISPYLGHNNGYHSCGYSQGAGFQVTVLECWKRGDPVDTFAGAPATARLEIGDRFRVSFIYNGVPIYGTHEISAAIDVTGCALLLPQDVYVTKNADNRNCGR